MYVCMYRVSQKSGNRKNRKFLLKKRKTLQLMLYIVFFFLPFLTLLITHVFLQEQFPILIIFPYFWLVLYSIHSVPLADVPAVSCNEHHDWTLKYSRWTILRNTWVDVNIPRSCTVLKRIFAFFETWSTSSGLTRVGKLNSSWVTKFGCVGEVLCGYICPGATHKNHNIYLCKRNCIHA